MIDVIERNKGRNVYVKTYNLGKEEILIAVALHYKTKVNYSKI
jgi:hypothetical protein